MFEVLFTAIQRFPTFKKKKCREWGKHFTHVQKQNV